MPKHQGQTSGALDGSGVFLVLAIYVLSLSLLAQCLWHFKDRLAAEHPSLKLVLQRFCKLANSQVQALRVLDAVVIDSAALEPSRAPEHAATGALMQGQAEPQTEFQLQVTLRNTAPTQVATSWLELTLTDAQGQVLARKVFNPAVWGAPRVMVPAQVWEGRFNLKLPPNQVPLAGYRLLAFYP